MLVSVDTKVRYKGREYTSLDEIPPDIRGPLEKAVARLGRGEQITAHLNSRLILNDRPIDPESLPRRERDEIAQWLEALFPIDRAICKAAVQERRDRIVGIVGLSTIAAGVAAFAARLWLHGYFL